MIEDWNEPPVYERAEDGSIKTWDFYGGSLKGIQNDLPRIAELGFTAIYLNPIFEAASNHRYDTADYTKIDPILGTEQDFTELCQAAEKLGISIILDGVFNHTGDDSIYFNRYGNYPGVGAWQSEDSPWRDAFYFHEDGSYDCWWGVGNMPAINESSELVRERLLGKDGVIRKWLRAGAHAGAWTSLTSFPTTSWPRSRRPYLPKSPMRCCSARSGKMPPTRSATAICVATYRAPSWTLLWITPSATWSSAF